MKANREQAPLLSISGLEVSFPSEAGQVRSVGGLSFELVAGRTLGIVGESGAGKSVAALAVIGLLPVSAKVAGSICLQGRELIGLDDAALSQIRGRHIGMIFQDPLSSLTPVLNVGYQLAEAISAHDSLTAQQVRARSMELLGLVGIAEPAARLKSYPHELSGGMRQRVMIAMAIANRPGIIVADEPTTALDVSVQAQVLGTLRAAQKETGAALLIITHDLGVIAGLADDVLVMQAGQTVEHGSTEAVFGQPTMPYTKSLLAAMPRIDRPRAARFAAIEGNPPSALAEVPRNERERVLEVTELERHFPLTSGGLLKRRVGTVRAVDGISFDIREGETLALVGESGCGKTTTLREIMSLDPPARGHVEILGRDVTTLKTRADRLTTRQQLQFVFQDPLASLDPRMTTHEILAEPMRIHGWKALALNARIEELMHLVGLHPDHVNRFPEQFSGGQRQRLAIARALAVQPKLLVLDEPVASLDVSIRAEIINLLEGLQSQLGVSYLFVTHDLAVVRHIADRVAVMYAGRIVEIGNTDEIFSHPVHPYTRELLSLIPVPDPESARRRLASQTLHDEIPSPGPASAAGCRFRPRCSRYVTLSRADRGRCDNNDPILVTTGQVRKDELVKYTVGDNSDPILVAAGQADHSHACHFPDGNVETN